MNLNVREATIDDIPLIANYWKKADQEYLNGMGVDISKMTDVDKFTQIIIQQTMLPYESKKSYALVWEIDGVPIGHSNLSDIEYGETAKMHLHIWESPFRKKGVGVQCVKMSLPFYFKNLKLKVLVCEPYALNPAPNKTLQRAGFTFEKKYVTVPGPVCFEQEVNRWLISHKDFIKKYL